MSKRSTPTCVLASGGIDSAALLTRSLTAGGRVVPLFLRCGLSWEAAELSWLRRFLRAVRSQHLLPLRVLDVPLRSTYGAHWSLTGRRVPGAASADAEVYLPGRNVLLLTHAAILCAREGLTTIALGTLKGNPFGDATPRFFRDMAACLSQALRRPIRVLAPLRWLTKPQLIRATPDVPWALTFSCLQPRGRRHCGRCNKCAERRRAFHVAGVPDPTGY